MAASQTMDMTRGNITSLLIRFSLPMLIGNLFQQAYNLGDSMIVGQYLGANSLAAVGVTGPVSFLFFSICNGIGSGCGVVASQCFGAGDNRMTRRAIANAAYIMFLTALVMGVAAFLAAPSVLRMMSTPDEILAEATVYMQMSCIGVPLVAVYNYASSMLRSLGDSRTPLYFLIFSCFLNLALDVLFICQFGMGVFGAALATIIAQIVSGVGCLLYAIRCNPYFTLTRDDMRLDWLIVGKSVRIGMPMALQWSLIAVSTTALQTFVNSFNSTAIAAAFTATNRIENLVHLPYGSISAALATYAGQNYGARNLARVRDGMKHGVWLSTIFTLVIMVAYQLLAEGIMSLFVKETEVIVIGAQALRLTSWFYIFLSLIYMCRGILNGVGDAIFALINGVVEVICRIGLPMLVVMIPGIGLWGIWWTAGITWMISSLFCLIRYVSWRRAGREIPAGGARLS